MNHSELPERAFRKSVLVVAHPDDEVLWFGSIAPAVTTIVICFMDDPANPGLVEARTNSLAEHPWRDRIRSLGIRETCTFNRANWPDPVLTEVGLNISGDERAAQIYRNTAAQLREHLEPHISNAENVFTHNPWGEYGHEEHVLVHRITTSLAETLGASVWYNNYASNWSTRLMLRYFNGVGRPYYRMKIDRKTTAEIAAIYRAHGAWTWPGDFEWFSDECCVQGPLLAVENNGGWLFPINLIRLPERNGPGRAESNSPLGRIRRRFMRLWSSCSGASTRNS